MHAAGQDGAAFEQDTGLSQAGDRDRFVTAYPTSWRFFWSYPERDHPRSGRRLIAATIRAAVALGCVDPRRVVVTGRSSGGRMTESAGCGLADRLLAIFPVSAGTKRLPACPNARPVSVIDFHGTADPIAPYRTVMHAMRGWARRDGCDAQAVRTRIEKDTLRFEWRHCARGVRVVHYRLLGAEHNWPPLSSAFTSDVDATREIVRWLGRLQG